MWVLCRGKGKAGGVEEVLEGEGGAGSRLSSYEANPSQLALVGVLPNGHDVM